MSAMPERVPFNAITIVEGERLVPEKRALDAESALLAAEARVREVEATALDGERDANETIAALRADLKAAQELEQLHLQNLDAAYADREALVPLARLGLGGLDGGSYYLEYLVRLGVSNPTGKETPATTQARAILARAVGA